MRVLVLATAYPELDGSKNMYYVHTRNLYYIQKGIEVEVLNFSTCQEYEIDGIKVFGLEHYQNRYNNQSYDILILHAANIRYHYKFIKKYGTKFPKFLFFFHGHEVLRCSKIYPKPYDYVKDSNFIKETVKDIYDIYKLKFWKKVFLKCLEKSWFVFVSQWMFDEFKKWIKLSENELKNRYSIIYNCIGSVFETESYKKDYKKKYDFVCVRRNLDGSKYGVDIIVRLAYNNPNKSFYLIGKGDYFRYRSKPENLIVENKNLNHKEIISLLNASRCALMPTRTDAQGVMACEMATFGIPLITSDIPVCREVFSGFENVTYISNEKCDISLEGICDKISNKFRKNEKYFAKNTCGKEVCLLNELYTEINKDI